MLYNSPMQKREKQKTAPGQGIGIVFIIWSCLCFSPLFVLQHAVQRISYTLFLLFVWVCSFLFWFAFFPNRPDNTPKAFRIFGLFITDVFNPRKTAGFIENGSFDRDYFTIQKKPYIASLFIDSNSIVIIKDIQNRRTVLSSGLWKLEKGSSIIHTFDLLPHSFTYGADTDQNLFKLSHQNHRNLKGLNAHNLDLERSRCLTKDGVELFPCLHITYRLLDPNQYKHSYKELLTFSAYLEGKSQIGNGTKAIEEYIGSLTIMGLRDLFNTLSKNDIGDHINDPDKLAEVIREKVGTLLNQKTAPGIMKNPDRFSWLSLFRIKTEIRRVWTR